MSLTYDFAITGREGFETPISGTVDGSADMVVKISDTVDAGGCNTINSGFPADDDLLHGLLLIADGDCTLTFYDSGDVEVGSVSMCEDVPVVYFSCGGFAIGDLVSADVSYMQVDNSVGTAELAIVGRIVYDNAACASPSP